VRQRGFTLLELLAAMTVLAVLSALSFRGLSSVLETEARLQAQTRLWSDVALHFAQLGEDMTMAVERPVRDADERTSPALRLAGSARESESMEGAQLVFTRLGIGEGAAAQSVPRRVGYRLREDKLEYLVWPAPDLGPGAQPTAYVMLEGVGAARWQALDAQGRWLDAWPAGGEAGTLPRAISVRLTLAGGEEVSRVLALR
jgi:general secretion pathway protein J